MVRRSARIRTRLSESSVTDDGEYHSDASSIASDNESSINDISKQKTKRVSKRSSIKGNVSLKNKKSNDDVMKVNELKKIDEEDFISLSSNTNDTVTEKQLQSDTSVSSDKDKKTNFEHVEQKISEKINNVSAALKNVSTTLSQTQLTVNQGVTFRLNTPKTYLDYINPDDEKSFGLFSDILKQNQCSKIPFLSQLRKTFGIVNNRTSDISSENDVFGLHLANVSQENESPESGKIKEKQIQISSDFALVVAGNSQQELHQTSSKYVEKNSKKQVDELMKKSCLPDNLESLEKAPKLFESYAAVKKERKKKQQETAGKGWFNMPKPELTEELKRDLQVIQMRNALDTKRHYKRADSKKLPTFFQVGTIVEAPHEFHSARVNKKQRKRTIVDELLADAEFRRKNKKRFIEIQKKNAGGGKGHYKKIKNKRKETWART